MKWKCLKVSPRYMHLVNEILNFGPNTFLVNEAIHNPATGLVEYSIENGYYEGGPNRIDELLLSKCTKVPAPDFPLLFINNFSSTWDSTSRTCITPLNDQQELHEECYQVGCKNQVAWEFGEARLCYYHAKSVWATAKWRAVGVLIGIELSASNISRNIHLSLYATTVSKRQRIVPSMRARNSSFNHLQFDIEDLSDNRHIQQGNKNLPTVARKQLMATFILQGAPVLFGNRVQPTLATLHRIIHDTSGEDNSIRHFSNQLSEIICVFRSILKCTKTDIIRLKQMYKIIQCFKTGPDTDNIASNDNEKPVHVFDPEGMKATLCRLVDKTSKLICINQLYFHAEM